MVYFEGSFFCPPTRFKKVSILVLMDGVLRAVIVTLPASPHVVSILVLMDGVLRASTSKIEITVYSVSILVLMDGVLRAVRFIFLFLIQRSFNPCSNGWCTSSFYHFARSTPSIRSFNPCSNGWCTSRRMFPVRDAISAEFQSLF